MMSDTERLAHYRQLSPDQRIAKRRLLLQHIMLYKRLRDEAGDNVAAIKHYKDLAWDCMQQHALMSQVMREG